MKVVAALTKSGGEAATQLVGNHTDNVLRVGLNYKFGGPVVAKY
jgi:hypothetical protein